MKKNLILINRLAFLPKVLIEARRDQGVTFRQLADQLGLKWQQVHRWEKTGYQRIGFDNLCAVAKALNIRFMIAGQYK